MAEQPRRKASCLAQTVGSLIDGGVFGAAIGSLMATGPAFSQGLFNGGLRIILRSGLQSALSVGGFMSVYNGGICSFESLRSKRDVLNPFLVGGLIGVAGGLPGFVRPLPTAPWAYRNPRALVGSGLGSAMLCSFFWMLSAGGLERPPAPERQPAPEPAAERQTPTRTRTLSLALPLRLPLPIPLPLRLRLTLTLTLTLTLALALTLTLTLTHTLTLTLTLTLPLTLH